MPQLPAEDYYKTLGVSPTATGKEIDEAYFAAIRRVHPDVSLGHSSPPSAGELEFRTHLSATINDAGTVLRNPNKRAVYDLDRRRALEKARRAPSPSRPAGTARPGARPSEGSRRTGPASGVNDEVFFSSAYREEPLTNRAKAASAAYRAPAGFADDPTFDDFLVRHKRRSPAGRPKNLWRWLWRYTLGQWLLTLAVLGLFYLVIENLLISRAIISKDDLYYATLRFTGVFMIAMAVAQHSLQNPAGDVFRLAMRLADKIIEVGSSGGRS